MKTLIFNLRNNLKKVGSVNLGFHKKTGYIINLEIEKSQRGKGYGTELLKLSENMLKNNYNVNKINLCAWNSIYDSSSNLDFFKKNGYKINTETTYHDMENDIFEVTGFIKKLHVIVK